MQDQEIDIDSGVDHTREAQRTTDFLNARALEIAVSRFSVTHVYIIVWKEGKRLYQTTWRGVAGDRVKYMEKGLRIDVKYGQWAAGWYYYDGAQLKWNLCGTSTALVNLIPTLPLPKTHQGR